MKKPLMLAMLAVLGLSACDRPTVVATPPSSTVAVPVPVPVPGPAGPQGEAGKPGTPGDSTVIVVPPASDAASANR